MIFTSLGLLIAAVALFIAGIVKSSVALLTLSLVVSAVAGAILVASFSAARRLTASGVLPGGGGVVPGAQPVVMYLSPDQLGLTGGNGGAHIAGSANPQPIVGYDDMSAQQVLSLVASGALSQEQLSAVRIYETGTAARKTILERVDKALAASR